ncbi:MAG: paraquat-inducible protein A [Opitutaceae bacterium]|nr:paraquat-inducible protein A [Opitutaceae bacterium]
MTPSAAPPPPAPGPPLALALAGTIMMVPANLLPVLSTNLTGQTRSDTIISGIVALWEDGMWGIAAIVFTASILIPVLKLLGLGWLLLAVRWPPRDGRRRRTLFYAVLDFIGRWSMLDVFLVAFLAGTVKFGALASVEPRTGIVAFTAVVVLTVLATNAFDPRWLWVEASNPDERTAPDPDGPAGQTP